MWQKKSALLVAQLLWVKSQEKICLNMWQFADRLRRRRKKSGPVDKYPELRISQLGVAKLKINR